MTSPEEEKAYFTQEGEGRDIVLLHGWGVSGESFSSVASHLSRRFRVTVPDLPGFGRTPAPPVPWGTEEYSGFVLALLDRLGIMRAHLLGHSFGGRIAVHIAASHPERVDRLVLVDSAGIPPRRGVKYHMKIWTYKALRTLLTLPPWRAKGRKLLSRAAARLGSPDYRSALGSMRGTLVRVVHDDLRPLLPSVSTPALLVWGGDDKATPPSDGKTMQEMIPSAKLIIFPGAGHFSYLDRLPQFLRGLDSFLEGEEQTGQHR